MCFKKAKKEQKDNKQKAKLAQKKKRETAKKQKQLLIQKKEKWMHLQVLDTVQHIYPQLV